MSLLIVNYIHSFSMTRSIILLNDNIMQKTNGVYSSMHSLKALRSSASHSGSQQQFGSQPFAVRSQVHFAISTKYTKTLTSQPTSFFRLNVLAINRFELKFNRIGNNF